MQPLDPPPGTHKQRRAASQSGNVASRQNSDGNRGCDEDWLERRSCERKPLVSLQWRLTIGRLPLHLSVLAQQRVLVACCGADVNSAEAVEARVQRAVDGAQPVEGERIWKKHFGESEQNSLTNKDGGRTMF